MAIWMASSSKMITETVHRRDRRPSETDALGSHVGRPFGRAWRSRSPPKPRAPVLADKSVTSASASTGRAYKQRKKGRPRTHRREGAPSAGSCCASRSPRPATSNSSHVRVLAEGRPARPARPPVRQEDRGLGRAHGRRRDKLEACHAGHGPPAAFDRVWKE